MKPYSLGIMLLLVAALAFGYQSLNATPKAAIGVFEPMRTTINQPQAFPLPPLLGATALLGGIWLLIAGGKQGPNRWNGSNRPW